MSGWPVWIKLPLYLAATAYFGSLAWRLRPFGGNTSGRLGGFTSTLAMALCMALVATDIAVRLAGRNLPRWVFAVMLAALVVAILAWFWAHVEELRAEWSTRATPPDTADYPTSDWKWAALWSTLIAIPLMYVFIRWNMPYVGILGICTSAIAFFSIVHWVWRRWELWVIRHVQARRGSSVLNA